MRSTLHKFKMDILFNSQSFRSLQTMYNEDGRQNTERKTAGCWDHLTPKADQWENLLRGSAHTLQSNKSTDGLRTLGVKGADGWVGPVQSVKKKNLLLCVSVSAKIPQLSQRNCWSATGRSWFLRLEANACSHIIQIYLFTQHVRSLVSYCPRAGSTIPTQITNIYSSAMCSGK